MPLHNLITYHSPLHLLKSLRVDSRGCKETWADQWEDRVECVPTGTAHQCTAEDNSNRDHHKDIPRALRTCSSREDLHVDHRHNKW